MMLPKTKHVVEQGRSSGVRRRNRVTVRHASDDCVLAMIEIVSPSNKSSVHAFQSFVEKASELLEQRIHLLLLDPFPPSQRDPNGIHAAIWENYTGEQFELPPEEPLTFVVYESADIVRGFIETLAVGNTLPDMPLFLATEYHISLRLEMMYQSAWGTVPLRWQRVIESTEG